MTNENIKMILPCKCPGCQEEILVCMEIPTPYIARVVTSKDVEKIREVMRSSMEGTITDPEMKKRANEMIDSDEILFNLDDDLGKIINKQDEQEISV